jgi:hypothetical protein
LYGEIFWIAVLGRSRRWEDNLGGWEDNIRMHGDGRIASGWMEMGG